MNLFYRSKHWKPRFPHTISFQWFHNTMNFIIDETIWYLKWWGHLVINFFRLLYRFGELILEGACKLIDKHDKFWDKFDEGYSSW